MSAAPAHPFTCEECGATFAPLEGGACSRCRRTLCGRHLFGWFGGWRRFLGEAPVCTACRRAEGGGGP